MILSGLCAKSSITVTPPAVPTTSSRRLVPVEALQRLRRVLQRQPVSARRRQAPPARSRHCARRARRARPSRSRACRFSSTSNAHAIRRGLMSLAMQIRQPRAQRVRAHAHLACFSTSAAVSSLSRFSTAISALPTKSREQRAQLVHALMVERDVVDDGDASARSARSSRRFHPPRTRTHRRAHQRARERARPA